MTNETRYGQLSDAIRRVVEAADLEEALEGLTAPFRDDFDLNRATVFVFTPSDHVRIIGTWGVLSAILPVGTDIAINLTEGTHQLASRLVAGEAVVVDIATADLGMLRDLAVDAGVKSAILMPLFDETGLAGILTMDSTRANAFTEADARFFTDITVGIAAALAKLIDASGLAD